ncbi:MAG: acyltransferase [Flavipsychrobacter sp.]|jgi:peptidoglycan/LPS O-acetylase OafA/YrhL|nr:acyltransferase [Flavipsychrobacter sp.]
MKQINSLTATRAFAAIMILIYHFGRMEEPFTRVRGIFMNGNLAVSYFYVLSGFVLYISYSPGYGSYRSYFKKRLARIAPAYYLALGWFILVFFCIYKNIYTHGVMVQIIYCALFIQTYIPEYAIVLNTAAWSISVEMFFYIVFPLLLFFQKKKEQLFIVFTIVIFLLTQILFHIFFKNDFTQTNNFSFFMYNPLMHINQFLVGMVGGYWFMHRRPFKKRIPFMPLALFCVILLGLTLKPIHLFFDVGLFAPLFLLFIISVAVYDPVFLNSRPLVFLGEISYGIYILQFPVYATLAEFNNTHLKLSPSYFFFFAFAILCVTAIISYYFIEKPIRNIVKRHSGTKLTTH